MLYYLPNLCKLNSFVSLPLIVQTPKEAVIEMSFMLGLAQEFSALVQSTSVLRLLGYMADLPEEKPSGTQAFK